MDQDSPTFNSGKSLGLGPRKRVYKQLTLLESFRSPGSSYSKRLLLPCEQVQKKRVQVAEKEVEIIDLGAYVGSHHDSVTSHHDKYDESTNKSDPNKNRIVQPDLLGNISLSDIADNESGQMRKKPKLELGHGDIQRLSSKVCETYQPLQTEGLTSTSQSTEMSHSHENSSDLVCESHWLVRTKLVPSVETCIRQEPSDDVIHEKTTPSKKNTPSITDVEATSTHWSPQNKIVIKRKRARHVYTRHKQHKHTITTVIDTNLCRKDGANLLGKDDMRWSKDAFLLNEEDTNIEGLPSPVEDERCNCKDRKGEPVKEWLEPKDEVRNRMDELGHVDKGHKKKAQKGFNDKRERVTNEHICVDTPGKDTTMKNRPNRNGDPSVMVEARSEIGGDKLEERIPNLEEEAEFVEEVNYIMVSTPQEREARRLARQKQLKNMRAREMAESRKERALRRRGGGDDIDGGTCTKLSGSSKSKKVSWKDGELVSIFSYSPI